MKIFIRINSIVFLLYGLAFILFPEVLSFFITEAKPTSKSALIDMRATYGGMSFGFGLLLEYMLRDRKFLRIAVLAIVLIVGGMALGRTFGMLLDGTPNRMMYIFLCIEIIVVATGLSLFAKQE